MTELNIKELTEEATNPQPWDFSNQQLYDLCRNYPKHKEPGVILAKILIISRVYAAAIERRRNKGASDDNDDFYLKPAVPKIRESGIDDWIAKAKAEAENGIDYTEGAMQRERPPLAVLVHGKVTSLFYEISGLEKRSLASKYLHFHVPDLFFIYDTRAVNAMRLFSEHIPRASNVPYALKDGKYVDNEYRKFYEKSLSLLRHCNEKTGRRLSPRQLDNLLLAVSRGV